MAMARLIVVLAVMLRVLAATANTNQIVLLLDNETTTTTTTEMSTTTTTSTAAPTTTTASTTVTDTTVPVTTSTTSTSVATADKYVSQGMLNLTMSTQDVDELTKDITKAKKVLGAAIASAADVEPSDVTVTKLYVNGEEQVRRLDGDDLGDKKGTIDVEFQIVSAKPPATSLKASELSAAIEAEAKAEGIEVKVESVESSIEIVSSPPAPAKPDEDSSSVAIVLSILAGCLVSFGMIGGFIYWYYRYHSESIKAGSDAGAGESHMV